LTTAVHRVWLDPRLPGGFRQAITVAAPYALDPTGTDSNGADLRIYPGAEATASRWVYALVAPFATIPDGVSQEDIRRSWQGERAGPFGGHPLLVDESTVALFAAFWGPPAQGAVQIAPSTDLLGVAWQSRPSWAIVPFEALAPGWKVLTIDGRSPLRKDFDLDHYPLTIPISVAGKPGEGQASAVSIPQSNRDSNKLTVLAMTGVTALVRATAFTMERQGITYPGLDVGALLRSADLTHISNEVPFASDCPLPDPVQPDMRFCSDPRYIGLLEDVGTDIVELTGDHFQDWGTDAMNETLAMYQERGWVTYGGGANLEEGQKPAILEHNGNRLAFIGCNAKGGVFAQAGEDTPGAVRCDMDYMVNEITSLRSQGYLPIATFQHFEYYTYAAQPDQQRDFRRLAEAGAVVVSGSQAHQPQGFEFDQGAFIHYGLGNLFFDQYDVSDACRQGFIDLHVFYDNRYIGTDLATIQFIDYARPRFMTQDERDAVLQSVFSASGW
jgi:poly-gamma-glutamate synthesis protein (capsule biosynthesis protein)